MFLQVTKEERASDTNVNFHSLAICILTHTHALIPRNLAAELNLQGGETMSLVNGENSKKTETRQKNCRRRCQTYRYSQLLCSTRRVTRRDEGSSA